MASRRGIRGQGGARVATLVVAGILAAAVVGWMIARQTTDEDAIPGSAPTVSMEHEVRGLCAACHVFPEPEILPKVVWPEEIASMYKLLAEQRPDLVKSGAVPDRGAVEAWYVDRAPDHLPAPAIKPEAPPSDVRFKRHDFGGPATTHGVSQVSFTRRPGHRPDILVADLRAGRISVIYDDAVELGLQRQADVSTPARVEAVDLDRDGHRDFVVASLGQFMPSTNKKVGKVVWLRRVPETGAYQTVTLVRDLGRVADARVADMDADGDSDMVVAVFGGTLGGELLYFENQAQQPGPPRFKRSRLDARTGATRVEIGDLDGDDLPDIVLLLSQQHEQVVAMLNQGDGTFAAALVHETRNPDFGYSNMRLADIDDDGDQDVLVTNGDATDVELVKPQHSVHILENRGRFPFTPHLVTAFPGAYDVAAGDLDNDGDQDIVAVAWLPLSLKGAGVRVGTLYPDLYLARETLDLSSIIWLEQTQPLVFQLRTIEKFHGDHVSVDVADCDEDGDLDLVTGILTLNGLLSPAELPPLPAAVTVWENRLLHRP